MMTELTTVAMTYNLWANHWWPQRESALRAFFGLRAPDILAVQELRPETCEVLDEAMPKHSRVDDAFAGWAWESNIWWRSDLFSLEESGVEDVGIASELRRLFWVRLRPLGLDDRARVMVATAHFTWPGNGDEKRTGINPRVSEAEQTVAALNRVAGDEACIFLGDLNDHHHPVRIFKEAGFQDCFTALGATSPVTSPVEPLIQVEGSGSPDVPRVIDYQFHRGPVEVRTAEVAEFFFDQTSPSDHKPVVATYTLYPGR